MHHHFPAFVAAITVVVVLNHGHVASGVVSDSAEAIRFFGTGSGQADRVTIQIDDNAGGADASTPADIGASSFTIEFCVRGTLADNTANPGVASDSSVSSNIWTNGNLILDRDIWSDGTGNVNDHNRDYGISFANGRVMFGTGSNGADAAPDGENTIIGSVNVLDGNWHHVACVRHAPTGTKSIYIDGVLDFSAVGVSDDDISYPNDGVALNPGSTGANNTLVIGAEKHDAGPAFPSFNGYFDELRLWKTALPAECIERFDNRVLVNSAPGRGPVDGFKDLVACYRFEEGAGTVAADSSGLTTNNAGTIIDGTAGMAEWVAAAADPDNTCPVYNGTNFGGPLVFKTLATGLQSPVFVTAAPGDNNRLFILERASGGTGRIRIYKKDPGTLLGTPFLTLTGINSGGEQGLLGLGFHPDYQSNGIFYIYYNASNSGVNPVDPFRVSVIQRHTVSANPDIANPAGTIVLTYPQPFGNHNGGWIGFNPSAIGAATNFLHIAAGDGGSGNDPRNSGQSTQDNVATLDADESLLGRILRYDVGANGLGFAPAAGNRWIGDADPNTNSDQTWLYGVRNPWRCSFDRLTGDFWIADVGQNNREEVNVRLSTTLDSADGNYGWRLREGFIATPSGGVGGPKPPDNVDPILDYPRDSGTGFPILNGKIFGQSITGGYVYRGSKMPALQGTYFFADYQFDQVFSIRLCNGVITEYTNRSDEFGTSQQADDNTITSFGEDNEGNLYITRFQDGSLREITQNAFYLWRNEQFTVSQLADEAVSGITVDIDNDGKSLVQEFVSGGSPLIPDGPLPAVFDLATDGGADEFLTLTLTRDPQSFGVVPIEGQVSGDLLTFDGGTATNADITLLIDNSTTFKFRDNIPATPGVPPGTRRFGRFKFPVP